MSAPERPPAAIPLAVRHVLALQASAGNQAVVRALARQTAAFNPESIVHDLRRAIDQAEVQLATMKRNVDVAQVIRVLDELTPDQIGTVERVYEKQEGTTLEKDLFGRGQSGFDANLKPDQKARIKTLLKGTGGAPQVRLEAVAIEVHELLGGSVDENKRERVVALYRRPVAEIKAFEAHYAQRYGHDISLELVLKLPGMHLSRVMALRAGNAAMSDAYAIEDKRRELDALESKKEAADLTISEMMGYEAKRRRLIDGITSIADANRKDGKLKQILSTPGAKGKTLGDDVAGSLKGTEAAGIVAAATPVEIAARRLVEMEARDTTNSAKIRTLIEALRGQGVKASEFIAAYDRLTPAGGRTWAKIVASADPENEEMLNALTAGGGLLSPVDELRHAIRKKDAARVNAVLRGQGTREGIKLLEDAYNEKFEPDLRQALFGITGAELAMSSSPFAPAAIRGRDAALADEYLNAPSQNELGKVEEVDWIANSAAREANATVANSGMVGTLRDIGATPETKALMEESAKRIAELREEWKSPANAARRDEILAEMKRVRATLTGDTAAYEGENEALRTQIRSAVSLAVQVGLALALPGVGSGLPGLVATTALNIGATVASNAVIWDEKYSLKMFYDDVVGGAFGALGGKLGEDAAKLVGKQVFGDAAKALSHTMAEAGQSSAVVKRFANAALVETGNIAGSTALTSAATGQDGFTAEGLLQNVLMNRLGGLRHGAAGDAMPAVREPHAPPVAGGHEPARPVAEPHAPPVAGGHEPARPVAEPHTAPGESAPGPAPAGSGGQGPTRRGTPGERPDAHAMWRSMERLASQWPGLPLDGRAAGVEYVANELLDKRGVSKVKVVVGDPGPGNDAAFDYQTWTIVVRAEALQGTRRLPNEPDHLSPSDVSILGELVRHEVDHVLQWWDVARVNASRRVDASVVTASMKIPEHVAEHAARAVERTGMSPQEQAAARALEDVLYSPSTPRDANITDRKNARQRLEQLKTEIAAAGPSVDPATLQERKQLEQVVASADAKVAGSLEERLAYDQGGVVRTESGLEQLKLEHQLAEDALKIAEADMVEIEREQLEHLAAHGKPDPALAADHANGSELVRRLRLEAADAAQKYLDAREAIPHGAPPAADGSSSPPGDGAPPGSAAGREPERPGSGGGRKDTDASRPPAGEDRAEPTAPKRETLVDKKEGEMFHESEASLRESVRPALEAAVENARLLRPADKDAVDLDSLLGELARIDRDLADQARLYFDALENPRWLENQIAWLWDQARLNRRTVAQELQAQLGHEFDVNEFNNIDLDTQAGDQAFREALLDPRPLIDLTFAHDDHGAHIHAFHEFLGDRLMGNGEGRRFRQELARVKASSDATSKPLYARLWNKLFDSLEESGGLHNPETLGSILEKNLDLPRWDATPPES